MAIYTKDDVPQMIDFLNTMKEEMKWYVCSQCNKLYTGHNPKELHTSKWGDEQALFCPGCTRYCKYCQESYCDYMEYQHDTCCSESEEDLD